MIANVRCQLHKHAGVSADISSDHRPCSHDTTIIAKARIQQDECSQSRAVFPLACVLVLRCSQPVLAPQADTDLLGEREAMQRSFAEYLSERSDWAATQAAAKAKILSDRYPGVVDDFTVEEVRWCNTLSRHILPDPSKCWISEQPAM